MATLTEILADKYTDKIANGLAERYDELFGPIRFNVRSVLEIGVDRGGSIEGWLEYFPNAIVYGIDLQPRPLELKDELRYQHIERPIKQFRPTLGWIANFDIIIDDGSHINSDVVDGFEKLWPFLIDGGYYVVEDIQVPYREEWLPPTPVWFENYIKEYRVKEYMFNHNILWLRK